MGAAGAGVTVWGGLQGQAKGFELFPIKPSLGAGGGGNEGCFFVFVFIFKCKGKCLDVYFRNIT